MGSPGIDPWAVATDTPDDPPAPANDPWGTAPTQGWSPSEQDASEAIQAIAPGATVTSAARGAQHNAEVGGVPDSMHLNAQAADVVLPKGMSGSQFKVQLLAQGYPVTEFLDEGTHVHWGWGAKGENPGTVPADPWAPAPQSGAGPRGRHKLTPEENAGIDEIEAYPDTPAPGWYDTIKAAVTSTPARWKEISGAALQALGEHPGAMAATPNIPMGEQELEDLQAPLEPARKAAGQKAAQFGQQLYAGAAADIKANMPNLDDSTAKRLAYQITAGTIDILPVIAATAVTRSPVAGGALIAAQSAASKYGEAREEGRSPDEAAMDASFSGIVNGALSTLPLGVLMKPGQTFLAKTLQGAGTFGAISVLTEALQIGYDKGLVNPNMTLKDAIQRVEDAGIVGTIQGAFLGGGHAAVESAVNRLHAAAPAPAKAPAAQSPPPAPAAPKVAPTPSQPAAGPVHAAVRNSLGLDRPGRAPEVDPWAPAPSPEEGRRPKTYEEVVGDTFRRAPAAAAIAPQVAAESSAGIPRRALEPDVAVTASGREVPVQYAVVEAGHLIPSQTQEGNPNPAFPAELQPRDRTRAVSQAQVAAIAQNINPRLLDRSVNAGDGAPIVAPSGVVESGNGRSLAIQRAYAEGLPSAETYRNYLEQQGYPVEGMEAPMLVRIRSDAMSPEDRQAFVREANQSGQLGYSSTERAMGDAVAMPDYALDLFRGGDVEAAANREFVQSFMAHALPATEHAAMVDTNGNLSLDGARRVRAAMLAKAYSDPDLVANVVENSDSSVKAIGNALTDASGAWAQMRSAANRGEIPPALDQTGKLLEAVALVARARRDGRNVAEFVGQPDIFTGTAIDPDTEAWLRLMFRNTKDWTQPVGRDKLAEALQFYAREALKSQVGVNLLGEQPVSPSEVLAAAKVRQNGGPSQTGPSLSFSEDVRLHGGEGNGPETQGAAAPGGEGNAPAGAEGASHPVVGRFGPRPSQFNFKLPKYAGENLWIGDEVQAFVRQSGVDPRDPRQAAGPVANYIMARGRASGFESLAVIGAGGEVTGHLTAATDNRKDSVKFSDQIMHALRDPNNRIVSIHNHPSNNGPSNGDVAALVYPGHSGLVVMAHDGDYHAMRIAADIAPQQLDKAARALTGAYKEAGIAIKKHIDPLFFGKMLPEKMASLTYTHAINRALERAGVIDYTTSWAVPEAGRDASEKAIEEAAANVRQYLSVYPNLDIKLADRSSEGPYRHPDPVQFAAGMARIFDGSGTDAGRPGSEGRAPGGAEAPRQPPEQLRLLEDERPLSDEYVAATAEHSNAIKKYQAAVAEFRARRMGYDEFGKAQADYKAATAEFDKAFEKEAARPPEPKAARSGPEQLKLLEDENRYEADRPPFYSALTRAVEGMKQERAPAQQWAGMIDNAQGVKQDEVAWSGVKDWLAEQKGRVSKADLLAHLRENEVRVQEVEHTDSPSQLRLERAEKALTDHLIKNEHFDQGGAHEYAMRAANGDLSPGQLSLQSPTARDLSHELQEAYESRAANNGARRTKFSTYTLPGGENYRELLLTLPPKAEGTANSRLAEIDRRLAEIRDMPASQVGREEQQLWAERAGLKNTGGSNFRSSHWDEPNVLAHVRFDDRTGPNGEKILHVAEIQSDWHQKGRRAGYELSPEDKAKIPLDAVKREGYWEVNRGDTGKFVTNVYDRHAETAQDAIAEARRRIEIAPNRTGMGQQVPNAPFKSSWHELAAKRMLRYAAEHGYDRLSWDTGDTNADRYDLSKHIEALTYAKKKDGTYFVRVQHKGSENTSVLGEELKPEELADHIGKDLAEKITNGEGSPTANSFKEFRGLDLKVGGEGMRGFYDKILPATVNKLAKKWGAKVEDTKIGSEHPSNIHTLEGRPIRTEADVHSVKITPAMRESVMQGQPLFEEARRYTEEPGAVDARGEALPQTIIPGAEPSAVQLAKARETAAGGKIKSKAEQKPPGGLFGAQGVPGDDQLSLFEDGRRYAQLPRDDRETLEKAARTGDWIGKYRAQGATPDARIRSSIAGAFKAWMRSARSVPEAVRSIFGNIGGGGGGGGDDGGLPGGFSDVPSGRPTETFSAQLKRAADRAMDLVHDAQMLVTPMAEGTPEARATAKDFANMMRLARYHGNRMMDGLKKSFTPDQRRKMWEAADEESVLRQKGEGTAGRGLQTLTSEERRAVLEQQADAQNVWQAAKDQGMVEGEGLPSYVPRMMVEMASTGAERLGHGDGAVRSIPGIGRNLKTSTPQMKQRKYLTTEETEAAGSKKFETEASVVKDIQTLPLATMRLREAVAGRALINKVKEIGQKTGEDTVVEGHEPAGTPYKWFTLDNPAFKTWRPKLVKNEETGKYEPAVDQNGDTIFEKVPLYVRGDFEGPLRAVLSNDSGAVYNAMMNMKARAMTAIMYSPLIHNAVEWGRALPGMPGKVATFRIYFEGNRAKNDPEIMTQAIMHGLVPIGHRGGAQDITSIANVENVKAGRSWTAKIVGAIPGLFSKNAQQAVYRTIDKMGDLWHNTLLWDRVGDLQMGLYVNFRDNLIKKGNSPDSASYMAAHFANRYAGALPLEAMSNMSRKIANLALFSRTYTLGNLGAMKDVLTGLPRDVQAQIERDGTIQELKGVKSMAARKALAILATDVALFYAGNSILQSAVSYLSGRQDLDQIEKGYVDRLKGLLSKVNESPLELLNPFADMQAVSATSENEPQRQNRVLTGYDKDGTAIYARNPAGKIGEEFTNWLTSPLQTLKSKFSTVLQPTYQVITNDAGFGRQVYDPSAKGLSGIATNLGKIVALYLDSQLPIESLKSAANLLKGQGTPLDTYKTLGPLAGITFSKGAPGGPGVGELYDLRAQQNAKQSAGMPAIIQKIKNGDIVGARADMRALGLSPGLQNYYVRVTQNPRLRLNTRSARELLRQATPDERARILQSQGAQ